MACKIEKDIQRDVLCIYQSSAAWLNYLMVVRQTISSKLARQRGNDSDACALTLCTWLEADAESHSVCCV